MKSAVKFLGLVIAGLSIPAIATSCNGGGSHRQGWVDGKFNISISARSDSVEKAMLNLYKEKYEAKHPEVNIIVDTWGSIQNSESYIMQNALNRGNITDILYTTDDYTPFVAEKNNFIDLRPYYEKNSETDYNKYYSTMFDLTSLNGDFRPTTNYSGTVKSYTGEDKEADNDKMYGVYFAPREYNQPALILNKTLFEELEVDIPKADENWDLDAFAELLHTISEKIYQKWDVEKISKYSSYRGIEMNQTWEPVYTSVLNEIGGLPIFTYDVSSSSVKSNLGSENNKNAFNQIVDLFGKDQGNKTKYAIDQDSASEDFVANTMFMAAVSYPEIRNYTESVKNISFLPFPTEYVGTGCGGYAILSDTQTGSSRPITQTVNGEERKLTDMCWDFIKYIVTEEGQEEAGKLGYIEPCIISMCEDPNGSWRKAFGENLDAGAFCAGKQLLLDSYVFAPTGKRTALREAVQNNLIKELFSPEAEKGKINDMIATANTKIDEALSK